MRISDGSSDFVASVLDKAGVAVEDGAHVIGLISGEGLGCGCIRGRDAPRHEVERLGDHASRVGRFHGQRARDMIERHRNRKDMLPALAQVPRLFGVALPLVAVRSEEHTSELQSLMRISYAVFCLKKKI